MLFPFLDKFFNSSPILFKFSKEIEETLGISYNPICFPIYGNEKKKKRKTPLVPYRFPQEVTSFPPIFPGCLLRAPT